MVISRGKSVISWPNKITFNSSHPLSQFVPPVLALFSRVKPTNQSVALPLNLTLIHICLCPQSCYCLHMRLAQTCISVLYVCVLEFEQNLWPVPNGDIKGKTGRSIMCIDRQKLLMAPRYTELSSSQFPDPPRHSHEAAPPTVVPPWLLCCSFWTCCEGELRQNLRV